MLMTTDPGDLVLDPTCGSGTTAYVAEQWGRRWITIDTSRVALALARQRLMGARFPYYLLADSAEGRAKEQSADGDAAAAGARPTDDIRHGFVYERVQHITLKSIANNPDIKEGMSREEIDAAIKRHADFELLYDKPYEDTKKVRVAGPFTVESLSPHRSLAFAGSASTSRVAETRGRRGRRRAEFEQTILDNLRRPASRTAARHERLDVRRRSSRTPARTSRPSASATDAPTATRRRGSAIAIGPQYGTVGPPFVKDAAREAIKADDLDLLCVLGFAFDPQVLGDRATTYVDAPTRASPTSPPSARSAGSRCCSCG